MVVAETRPNECAFLGPSDITILKGGRKIIYQDIYFTDKLSQNHNKLTDDFRQLRQETGLISNELQQLNTKLNTGAGIGSKEFRIYFCTCLYVWSW